MSKIAVFLMGILVVQVAHLAESHAGKLASPGPECTSGRAYDGWTSGITSGQNLAKRVWGSIDNCDRVEEFASILQSNVDRLVQAPPNATPYVACRLSGIVAGVYAEVDDIWVACEGTCCKEGKIIGDIAAKLYCELSIALGGLAATGFLPRDPVFTCGLNFESCCDGQFVGTSTRYINPAGARCEGYTRDIYTEAYNQFRDEQCAYTPRPSAVSESDAPMCSPR